MHDPDVCWQMPELSRVQATLAQRATLEGSAEH